MGLYKINLNGFNLSFFKRGDVICLYIYNNNFFCFLKFSKFLKIKLRSNNALEIYSYINDSRQQIEVYLKQFHINEFSKIKFAGKGYKIKKNSNKSIILLFNRAHVTILWWNNIILNKLKKYKFYVNYNNIDQDLILNILKIRPINIFTKKGLRKSRQILLKKRGKK